MPSVTGLAQVAYNGVGLNVDKHSRKEDNNSDDELRRIEPFGSVDPTSLHECVEQVEDDTHTHDTEWHAAIPFNEKGEYERALEIMNLKQDEECDSNRVEPVFVGGENP